MREGVNIPEISHREFIKYALLGMAAFAGGIVVNRYGPLSRAPRLEGKYSLGIAEALVEMVDRKPVYHWAFEDLEQLRPTPQMPGPLIDAIEDEELELSITNSLSEVHGFRIPGVPGEVGRGIEIGRGETREFSFLAPKGGSYLYFDHPNAPVNRILRLHGPMIILPGKGHIP